MSFAAPYWLLALLALPVAAALEAAATRRDRQRTARLVARPLWDRVLRRPRESWRFVRLALLLAGVAGVVLALARPQWGIVREKVEREGVDVVLALDTSGSMATEDVAPSRIFLARAALQSLVTRLTGDRFGLLAFEGEAYPLVPLTLDADAVLLFLETAEPGIVPAPGSSLGLGLAEGLEMFVDRERRNKVMVLVSDGEDLEGEVEDAVQRARRAGVIVHTVGVGTESGQPVPDFDREGERAGFKRDEQGSVVVSRLNAATLMAIARGTGGRFVRLSGADTSLHEVAAAIEGMEERALRREYTYRKKERFQWPLGLGLLLLTLALGLPLPRGVSRPGAGPWPVGYSSVSTPLELRRRGGLARAALLAGLLPTSSAADDEPASPSLLDELLLRPRRQAARGIREYEAGNHPRALEAFSSALASRPDDPRARFNLGAGLYKTGKLEEAAAAWDALAADARSPLAAAARFNLGNALYQKQDYAGAVRAYRDVLRLNPTDGDARRNLELALRQLQKQQEQQKQSQEQKQKQEQGDRQQAARGEERAKSPEEREQERFQKEAGMPKERAMQLLQALQQNEKAEQKKRLAAQRAQPRRGKDW